MGHKLLWLLLPVLLLAAAVRIVHIDDSRFMAERQYRSALIARSAYLAEAPDVPQWRKDIAARSADRLGVLEPTIMESLAVLSYRILGKEDLRAPRLLAAGFWIIGAVFLFGMARELAGDEVALYSTIYYLFLPLGVSVSISFIPDALMLMLFTASLWSILRLEKAPSIQRLLLTGTVAGLCVLVKPLCVFAIAFAFIALRWNRAGIRGVFDWSAIALGVLVLLPALSYYLYGIYVSGDLAGQAGVSFVPALLVQPHFWVHTLNTALDAVGIAPIVLAVIGFALPAQKHFRPMMIGIVIGQVLLILVFTYHVRMAAHYHLPLAIPVAICLGVSVAALVARVRELATPRWLGRLCLVSAASFIALGMLRDILMSIRNAAPIVQPEIAREVGALVGHSDRVVYVSQYYGMPLEYYGELSGWYWPRSGTYLDRALHGEAARPRSVEQRLASLGTVLSQAAPDFVPEYFIVTDFREFRHHADLQHYLKLHCKKLADTPDYLVFGSCHEE
jgi:4-amino-4-deoxy-L-arabinose transferase-like glycosyltransferase